MLNLKSLVPGATFAHYHFGLVQIQSVCDNLVYINKSGSAYDYDDLVRFLSNEAHEKVIKKILESKSLYKKLTQDELKYFSTSVGVYFKINNTVFNYLRDVNDIFKSSLYIIDIYQKAELLEISPLYFIELERKLYNFSVPISKNREKDVIAEYLSDNDFKYHTFPIKSISDVFLDIEKQKGKLEVMSDDDFTAIIIVEDAIVIYFLLGNQLFYLDKHNKDKSKSRLVLVDPDYAGDVELKVDINVIDAVEDSLKRSGIIPKFELSPSDIFLES